MKTLTPMLGSLPSRAGHRLTLFAWLSGIAILAVLVLAGAPRFFRPQAALVSAAADQPLPGGPPGCGTNAWWTDQDAALWSSRYTALSPSLVRVPIPHFAIEPVNDNADPALADPAGFHFDQAAEVGGGRTLTFSKWLAALREQNVSLILYFPYLAPWLSRSPAHTGGAYAGLYAPYPPNDLAEYEEFVRAVLAYLVDDLGYAPDRLLVEAANEPDLACGADPATACFWKDWDSADLRAVVSATDRAVQAAAPGARLLGLAECCGTALVLDLLDNSPEGTLLDGLSFHAYTPSTDFSKPLQRAAGLEAYNKPLYLDEYGSFAAKSDGSAGAIWHSLALAAFWKASIAPLQFSISEWPLVGEPYSSLGLMQGWDANWAAKPSFWVHSVFFRRMCSAERVSATVSGSLDLLAVRSPAGDTLLWVTNPANLALPNVSFEITGLSASQAQVVVFDNQAGGGSQAAPLAMFEASGNPLRFVYSVPPSSSLTFVVGRSPQKLAAKLYLPLIRRP